MSVVISVTLSLQKWETCHEIAKSGSFAPIAKKTERQHSAEAFYNTDAKYIDLVKAAICDVTGRCAKLSCNGGTSDGRFAAKHGWPIIELGLKNQTAHQINEQANLNDITQLQQVYRQILQRLLA